MDSDGPHIGPDVCTQIAIPNDPPPFTINVLKIVSGNLA